MKCSIFIATSTDGYIADEDGGVEWLETAGKVNIDLGNESDMGFINDMTITRAPILLGCGIPLFGKINEHIKLGNARVSAYPNDFITTKYTVNYL